MLLKTKIITILNHPNPINPIFNSTDYQATVIVPADFSIGYRSELKKLLNKLLVNKNPVLKNVELKISKYINTFDPNTMIERNFNLVIEKNMMIPITSFHSTQLHFNAEKENINVSNYLSDFSSVTENMNPNTKVSLLMFNYNLKLNNLI